MHSWEFIGATNICHSRARSPARPGQSILNRIREMSRVKSTFVSLNYNLRDANFHKPISIKRANERGMLRAACESQRASRGRSWISLLAEQQSRSGWRIARSARRYSVLACRFKLLSDLVICVLKGCHFSGNHGKAIGHSTHLRQFFNQSLFAV